MKRTLELVKKVVTWAFVILAIAVMLFTIVSSLFFNRNDRNLFGCKMFIVMSDSMSATDFSAGDIIISRKVDTATLQEGDIITFQSLDSESYGEIITHKIRTVSDNGDGTQTFVTYGTTTGSDDPTPVQSGFVLGKYSFHIPKVGTFFSFMKTTVGYFVCIFIPFMVLIVIEGANTIKLFRQYKAEQSAELEAERKRNEEEKLQNRLMMQKLLELQQQLKDQGISVPEKAGEAFGSGSPASPEAQENPDPSLNLDATMKETQSI